MPLLALCKGAAQGNAPWGVDRGLFSRMTAQRNVSLLLDPARHSHRKIIMGVAAYVRERADWALHVELDPVHCTAIGSAGPGSGIITAQHDAALSEMATRLGVPVIGVEDGMAWRDPSGKTPFFATDSAAVGRMGAEHLLEQGFKRLAYCATNAGGMAWSEDRGRAFCERAIGAGVACESYVGSTGNITAAADEKRRLIRWLEGLEKPVGVMACHDACARQVLDACHQTGLRVPEDIAVLGADNDEVLCELASPALTSIEHGSQKLGYEAAALLHRLFEGRTSRPPVRNLVPPERVVPRRSTDATAIDDDEVAAAVHYIRRHACDPIQVADVLDLVQLSRATLKRRFKAVTGRTVLAEIQRVRIERAKHLLLTSDLSLKQVAARTGFCSMQYLTSVFHQHVGETPSEYRRRMRV